MAGNIPQDIVTAFNPLWTAHEEAVANSPPLVKLPELFLMRMIQHSASYTNAGIGPPTEQFTAANPTGAFGTFGTDNNGSYFQLRLDTRAFNAARQARVENRQVVPFTITHQQFTRADDYQRTNFRRQCSELSKRIVRVDHPDPGQLAPGKARAVRLHIFVQRDYVSEGGQNIRLYFNMQGFPPYDPNYPNRKRDLGITELVAQGYCGH